MARFLTDVGAIIGSSLTVLPGLGRGGPLRSRGRVYSHAMEIPGLQIEIDPDAIGWHATGVEGISLIFLHPPAGESGGEGAGSGTARDSVVLIRMEPGHGYPAHRHLDVEDVLVLAGGYRDERGVHRQGSFVRYESGSMHSPVACGERGRPAGPDHPACVLFAIARGGIELVAGA